MIERETRLYAPGVAFRGDEPFTLFFMDEAGYLQYLGTQEDKPPRSAWDKMRDWWHAAVARVIPVGLSRGDAVVFTGSNPGARREWVVEGIDRPRTGEPRTCTIRRGSIVKHGISLSRLEKTRKD